MPLPKVPLLTSLALGGAAGVMALSSMTGASGAVNTSDTEQPRPVVTRPAPCPAGTVDTPTACVRKVTVHVPAPATAPRTVVVTSPRAPEPAETEQAAPVRTRASEAPEPRETEHEDAPDQEHEDAEHEDGTETESDG